MTFKLTYENMLYLAIGLFSIFIIYKLVQKYDSNNGTEEGFQSVINKFKNSRNSSTSSNTGKNNTKNLRKKSRTGGVSFDDLVTEAEDMDPERYTVDNIKNNFFTYLESFQKAKFKNVTGTTDEALEKFEFFKDKFFEIFK